MRVMTFNIRCGHANDGPNHWDRRRDLLAEVIRAADPDVLAVQECIERQADWLRDALPGMTFHGTPRGGSIGGRFGPQEMCTLFWRRDALDAIDTGTAWLSPTPDVSGSVGWDAAFPRVVTWARLQPVPSASASDSISVIESPGEAFTVANAHLDHAGVEAREQSCAWLRDWLPGEAAILVGDFNALPDGPAYQQLTAPRPDGRRLIDTHRALGRDDADAGTFHNFAGGTAGPRIDWVLTTDDVRVRDAVTDRTARDGRYPSDHYPVIVDLVLQEP